MDPIELFLCETYRCRLSPAQCVQRQKNAVRGRVKGVQVQRAGSHDWNCRDCAQGRAVAAGRVNTAPVDADLVETIQQEAPDMETKICSDSRCAADGKPQPIGAFNLHGRSKKPMGICKACQRRRISEGQQRRHGGRSAAAPAPEKKKAAAAPTTEFTNNVMVDFGQHPELLARIHETAALELRSPENQLLWMVRVYQGQVEGERFIRPRRAEG